MQIRLATPDDDAALAALDARSWPAEVTVVPPGPADAPFFSARRSPDDILVATDGDDVVGFVHLARHIPIEKNAHVLHVNALVVDADRRGGGIGAALVDAAIAEARLRGVRKLGLRALSTNERALGVYRRAGFVEEGRLRDEIALPDGGFADDMWLALFLDAPAP